MEAIVPHEVSHYLAESPQYAARRAMDPLQVAFMDAEAKRHLLEDDKTNIVALQEPGREKEVIEFVADYVYRSIGITAPAETARIAQYGAELITGEQQKQLEPTEALYLQRRMLDFQHAHIFATYHAMQEQLAQNNSLSDQERDAKRGQIYALQEAKMVQLITHSTAILLQAQHTHESLGDDSRESRGLRGQMFELLYTTYKRLELYQNEQIDEVAVFGATDFEDRANAAFGSNHNYDVLTVDALGNTQELVQCKNYVGLERYSKPIRKVEGHAFRRFMQDPLQFTKAIRKLIGNDVDTDESSMRQSRELLDSLFGATQSTSQRMERGIEPSRL